MQHTVTLTNSEISHRINENIHSEKIRKVMYMKFVDGYTYERIAEVLEMSTRQIQNIVRQYRNTLEPEKFTEICFS